MLINFLCEKIKKIKNKYTKQHKKYMEDLIKNHVEYLMAVYKKTTFDLATVKLVLITKFNNKSLMYNHIARTWFAQYFELVKALGYGKFDKMSQSLVLNTDNEYIQILATKYHIV